MTSLQEQINEGWKAAMRSGDTLRRDTLSGLRAAIKNVEINARTGGTARAPLEEAAVQQVIQREVKKRHDAIAEYTRANRPDRAAAEEAELKILQEFMPAQLSEAEITAIVQQAMEETGAQGAADMGRLMKAVMPRVAGRADGKQVNAIVRQLLS
ncbi:MAG: GatB/YqeY domain-containing protein [Abitibacteriaceae bacterium]|nr:GatB/YqeY domain-containing protein [Abditibacteriaceae bacterium]MBV9865023.1 GatB/YqeY domain-containing protein [Abditibacteriaceae bacterium]